MPSPSTPRRSVHRQSSRSAPSKSKTVDVGKPLGNHDTNSVRDRIRQWQEQVGDVVPPSEVGVENLAENVQGAKTRRHNGSPPTDSLPSRGSARRKEEAEEDDVPAERSKSTPRKRVVSDEHWKKTRVTPKTGDSPLRTRITREEDPPETPTRDFKSSRRKRRESGRRSSGRHSGDGLQDYDTRPPSRRKSIDLDSALDGSLGVEDRRRSDDEELSGLQLSPSPSPPPIDPTPMQRKEPTPEKRPSSRGKDDGRTRRRSQRKSDAISFPPKFGLESNSTTKDDTKAPKVSLLSKVFDGGRSKSINQEPRPTPSPPPTSIEAWLHGTADPFVDDPEPAVEVPAPLMTHSSRRKSRDEEETPGDPNDMLETIQKTGSGKRRSEGAERRRRRRMEAASIAAQEALKPSHSSPLGRVVEEATMPPEKDDVEVCTRESSPSSALRRSGAYHRRQDSSSPRTRRDANQPKESAKQSPEVLNPESNGDSVVDEAPFEFAIPAPLNLRRQRPPTGGRQLSTIASVDTLRSTSELQRPAVVEPRPKAANYSHTATATTTTRGGHEAANELAADTRSGAGLKRRLTTHEDLMSVLSLPQTGRRSIRSARSIRTTRTRLSTATISDLLQEFASDESKYMRELRTLVDGVIPVLLTCVLSKNDSSVAAGLFESTGDPNNELNFTKPIVDMGIALERLRTLHKRVPQQDPDSLLIWAQSAQRVYSEYLTAWRLGFQDVVVNLAPAGGSQNPSSDMRELDSGMARDADGDVINGDGVKVDVAFLLKRPLVRLKYLAKTFKCINIKMASPTAAEVSSQYQGLVDDARRRVNEEKGRMEDKAAADIDATRSRDLRTLGVLEGTTIERTRTVRARDCFNLTVHHSTGQLVDCRSELLLRDNRPGNSNGGDLLICEVGGSGKWLMFPPVETQNISARNGDSQGEIVVMIRGEHGREGEWHELLTLKTEDEEAGFEWVQMLGLYPVPPKLERSRSFISTNREVLDTPTKPMSQPSTIASPSSKSRTPSPREVDVPLGKQASVVSRSRRGPPTPRKHETESRRMTSPTTGKEQSPRTLRDHFSSWIGRSTESPIKPTLSPKAGDSSSEPVTSPTTLDESSQSKSDVSPSGLHRTKAKRLSRHVDESTNIPQPPGSAISDPGVSPKPFLHKTNRTEEAFKEWSKDRESQVSTSSESAARDRSHASGDERAHAKTLPQRPQYHRSKSSVPSKELPTIPKIRSNSPSTSPLPPLPVEEPVLSSPLPREPQQSPSKLQKKLPTQNPRALPLTEDAPAPPPHRSPSPIQLKSARTPKLGSPTSATRGKRRSSSPLKHQYEPSTASESSSDSEGSTSGFLGITSESELSDEDEIENGDVPTPLPAASALRHFSQRSPPASLPTLPSATLAPSNSASQAPYKTVPSQPAKSSKAIASIFSWSLKGSWEPLHEDECSIVITPGLIEVWEMSAWHSKLGGPYTDQKSDLSEEEFNRPLVAMELTPNVAQRRGTALDVSIVSPPTANSRIQSCKDIMFRSRNPEECEALYRLIFQSKHNNPTFIALENARGPFPAQTSAIGRGSTVRHKRSSSWFGLGAPKKGYRASSAPTPSVTGMSESSVGTMASAFSALKRFGANSKAFSISRSSVTYRPGDRAGSRYSSSSAASGTGTGSGTSTPRASNVGPTGDGAIGLSNTKIRLYQRESVTKWVDMGSARLTITKPPPEMIPGPVSSPNRLTGQEKRIIIHGKTSGEVLLDACLGESCFERPARTGIAVSVWEETIGPNGEVGVVGAVGGVAASRKKLYMMQMKSEAEAAYTFSLVGRLRY